MAEQYETITRQIEIEDDYFHSREDQWMLETIELLNVRDRKLRKEIQAIDHKSNIENICMDEIRRMFSEYTESINNQVENWETMYTNNMGVIDLEIMSLEHEEKDLDESHEELLVKFHQLRMQINEFEERNRRREEADRIIW